MEWIDIKKKLPRYGQVVDLWADGARHTNFERVRGDNWPKGYFTPTEYGRSVITVTEEEAYTHATHWMPLPEPPKV